MIPTVTVNDIIRWKPCSSYTEERVIRLFAGKKELSGLDILDLPIRAEDKLWAVLRRPFFSDRELQLLACDFAERVLPNWESWAKEHAPEHAEALRKLIQAARESGGADNWAALDATARDAWGVALDSAARGAERNFQIKHIRKTLEATKERLIDKV